MHSASGVDHVHALHLPAASCLRVKLCIRTNPVGRDIQDLVAPDDLIAQLRIKVHAVLIDHDLDGSVVAFGLDAHQCNESRYSAFQKTCFLKFSPYWKGTIVVHSRSTI